MARSFDDSANDKLSHPLAILTGEPITMACWFRSDDDTTANAQTLMNIGNTGSVNGTFSMDYAPQVAGDPVRAVKQRNNGNTGVAATTTGATVNTWHHACARFLDNNDRDVLIDGGSQGSNTTNLTDPTLGVTTIGVLSRSADVNHFSGRIAEAALWNVYLTDAEVQILAAGFSPILVRQSGLVAYWPLLNKSGALQDIVGQFGMTATGTTVADHVRVIKSRSRNDRGITPSTGQFPFNVYYQTAG